MAIDYLVEPWAHQRQAVEAAAGKDCYALFFEQGCGKTAALINILRQIYVTKGKLVNTLIICPDIVVQNWRREFAVYSRISESQIKTAQGTFFNRMCELDNVSENSPHIVITNYYSLLMEKLVERLLKISFPIVILDESHKIKDPTAKTTKSALKVSKAATHRFILTGTPILNSAMDIFSQFHFLDRGRTFGEKHTAFREQYFVDFNAHMPRQNYFPKWVVKPRSLEQINLAIKPQSLRILKKDCLDLPPLIRQRINIELSDEQSSIYRSLEKDMVAKLNDGTDVVTDLAITQILRLQQLVSGYITNENEDQIEFDDNPRERALLEVLSGIGPCHKVLIWAVFQQNYRAVRRVLSKLNLVHREVVGGMSSASKQKAVDDFSQLPNVRVLLGHPQSAGIGVNLVAASYSIFYSRSYSLENDLQAEARNYRGGSERHSQIVRIDLVTSETIDEVILDALAAKQELGDAILKHYKRGTYGTGQAR